MKTEYREVISLLHNGYSVRDVAKLSGNGVSTVQRVRRLLISTITAIKLSILRSFQRKDLCNSGLKAKGTTFACNNKQYI